MREIIMITVLLTLHITAKNTLTKALVMKMKILELEAHKSQFQLGMFYQIYKVK